MAPEAREYEINSSETSPGAVAVEPKLAGPVQVLLDHGMVSEDQLDSVIKRNQDKSSLSVLHMLVKENVVDEVLALQAIAAYCKFPFMRMTAEEVDKDVFALLSPEYMRSNIVIPVRRQGDSTVIALSDPVNAFLLDDIRHHLQTNVQVLVSPTEDIVRIIDDLTGVLSEDIKSLLRSSSEEADVGVEIVEQEAEDVSDLRIIAGRSPVIQYVNHAIVSAIRNEASDIHIQMGEDQTHVRYRVDGVLMEQSAPPRHQYLAIISRLKIMAELDIAERRLPQDGRIRVVIDGRRFDLRISTFPTSHGEKCVIRILDDRMTMVGLDKLGMDEHTLEIFREQANRPHGVFLVTGPTGSGKSTTLYSALRAIDRQRLNVCTIEDPVEYEMPMAAQSAVHTAIGMTFARALRAMLRQDPDVVMVGEIRDEETARIAVRAALTGHLVLSTLHTNDAPSAVIRLLDIGMQPYLIAAAVNAVLAQRLVRRICPNCKTVVTDLTESEKVCLEKYEAAPEHLYRGTGCARCRKTGYKGRVGVYEMLVLDDSLRSLITHDSSLNYLRNAAREHGLRTLAEDGLAKAASGLTTVEEILRVTTT